MNQRDEKSEDFSWVTDEMWVEALKDIIRDYVDTLLGVPGVYESVSEYFNDEALRRVSEKHDPDGIKRFGENAVHE